MSPPSGTHLEWSAVSGGLVAVETSSDLIHWERILTQSCNGGAGEMDDPAPSWAENARFYRLLQVPATLGLSSKQLSPGQLLIITGTFDPTLPTWAGFRDANGREILLRTFRVVSNTVSIAVPPLVGVGGTPAGLFSGPVAVTVQQLPATGVPLQVQGAGALLEIRALPSTGLPAGTIALAWFDRLSKLLATATTEWELLCETSGDTLDIAPLIRHLSNLRTNVDAGRAKIQAVVQGQTPRLSLGDFGGRPVDLDLAAVEVLDRLLAAFLVGARPGAGARSIAAVAGTPTGDPLGDLDAFFSQMDGPDAKGILNGFDQANLIAGAGVGILATTAVVLGTASAPVAAAMAGTAGAVLFFTAYVAPSVMAASSQALAAPFIEVQAGRPVPSLDDYRPALSHLQKGSLSYLTDEVIGRLVRGVFTSQHASDEVTKFFELYVNTSRSLLNLQDLDQPDSLGSKTYQQAPELFAQLKPSGTETDGTYIGSITGSTTETYPDAGWRHDVTGTLTLVVRGHGTVADPYHGSLTFLGENRITLVFCHSSVGCDPGGTLTLRISDGDLYGAHSTLEGEGLGSGDGTGSFSIELTNGVFQGDTLKATAHVELGVDQPILANVTLNRVAGR